MFHLKWFIPGGGGGGGAPFIRVGRDVCVEMVLFSDEGMFHH